MELFIILFIFIILFTLAWASSSLAPWVPTWKKDLKRICELADLQPGNVFYDLGCGDGRLVIFANKHYQAKSIGIELSLPFYLLSKMRELINHRNGIKFKLKNLYNENLTNADVIFMFAASSERIKDKLKLKLKTELKPGAKVISYVFPIIDWQPKIISKPTNNDLPIYLYII